MRQFRITSGILSVIFAAIFGLAFWTGCVGRVEATPLDPSPRGPRLVVSPSSVCVGSKFPGEAFRRTVSLWNRGRQTLTGTASAKASWVRLVDPASFVIPGGRRTTIGIIGNFPRESGPFDGTMTIRSNGGNRTVRIYGTVRKRAPAISVSSPTIDPIVVTPRTVDLGTILTGETFRVGLTLTNSTERTLTGSISTNGAPHLFLTASSFELGPGKRLSLGLFGHAPMSHGPFEHTITILHGLGHVGVRVEGFARDCEPDMPDWLQSGMCPPSLDPDLWDRLPLEDQQAILARAMAIWESWIQRLIEEDRLCEADLEEFYQLLQGYQPLWVINNCRRTRKLFAEPRYDEDQVLARPGYLDQVMWSGTREKVGGHIWYEVLYDGRTGWMQRRHLAENLPFDLFGPMVAFPRDAGISDALAAKRGAAQFIDVTAVVPNAKPEIHTRLCGQFCVTALLGERIGCSVLNFLKTWTSQDHASWRDEAIDIVANNRYTGFGHVENMLHIFGVRHERVTRHASPHDLEKTLDGNRMMIALVTIDWCGSLAGTDGHWVIVEDAVDDGETCWVRIYNPFWNQEEIYTYDQFDEAWNNGGIWVFRDTGGAPGAERIAQDSAVPESDAAGSEETTGPIDDRAVPDTQNHGAPSADSMERSIHPVEVVTIAPLGEIGPEMDDPVSDPHDQVGQHGDPDLCARCGDDSPCERGGTVELRAVTQRLGDENREPDPLRFALRGPGAIEDEGPVIYCFNPTPDSIRCVVKGEGGAELDVGEAHGATQSPVARQTAPEDVDPASRETSWQRKRIDLGGDVSVRGIRLELSEVPEKPAVHQVWASPSSGPWRLVHEFQEPPGSGDILEAFFDPAPGKVRYLEIRTLGGPDLISDLEVF